VVKEDLVTQGQLFRLDPEPIPQASLSLLPLPLSNWM
jgi:hypothetical protein